jgi:hypothetical protein
MLKDRVVMDQTNGRPLNKPEFIINRKMTAFTYLPSIDTTEEVPIYSVS